MADTDTPKTASGPRFLDRVVFDTEAGGIYDESRRYIMIRPEVMMGVFRALPADARRAAFDALEEGVYRQGSDSARAYLQHGGGDLRTLLATIEATSAQLGWGRWTFTIEPQRLQLVVDNSPFAQAHGPSAEPVCRTICGMLRGLGEMWFGAPAAARELGCAATGEARCRFEAVPAGGATTSEAKA